MKYPLLNSLEMLLISCCPQLWSLILISCKQPNYLVYQKAAVSTASHWGFFSLQTVASCTVISQEELHCCRVSTGCHEFACSSWPRIRRCLRSAWPLPTICARRRRGCSCTTCTWTACPQRGWTPSVRKACRGWSAWLCRLPNWRMRRGKASCTCLGARPPVHKHCGTS